MTSSQLTLGFSPAPKPRGPRVVVLPDSARVEERLLESARASALVAGQPFLSLAELERALLREARVQVAPPLAVMLAVREAARTRSHGPYFAVREQPGYASALQDLLAALSHGLLLPEELAGLDVPPRPRALGETLAGAREILARAKVVDPGLGLLRACEHLERGGALPAPLRDAGELVLEGIHDWTPLRVRLASALSRRLPVRVRLPFTNKPSVDVALDSTLRALEKLGEGPAPELELGDPARSPFLQRLFAAEGEKVEAEVALVSCASPAAQAREVARRCAALLREGARPDSIAVAARSLAGGVAEELGAALERAGVPWRERRGRPALPAGPVRLALSFYELVERGFPREPLIDLLSTRALWLQREQERLPAQAVARLLREAHVRDERNLVERLDALALREPLEAAHVRETKERALRLIGELRALPERATLADHGAALLALVDRFGLERKLQRPASLPGSAIARASEQGLARDRAAFVALRETCLELGRADELLGRAAPCSRESWVSLLATALSETTLATGGARGSAIQLVELRELPGRSFEHLFVTGLVEGELPASPAPDPLLSDEERRSVNRAAHRPVFRVPAQPGETAVLPPRQAEEPLLFLLGLASARRATLLWPRADAQGRELLRSSFADEAERALASPVERVALSALPSAGHAASAGDLLARAALDAFADPAFRVSPPADASAARARVQAIAASPLRERLARIARAAAAERERVRVFIREIPPGRFSGQLSGKALSRAATAFAFTGERPASARQLQEFATCAFRTLGHRLLRVSRDVLDDEELGKRERGDLLHLCLEKFFRARRAPLQGTQAELDELRALAAQEMDAYARRRHTGHPALYALQREQMLRELEGIIRAEVGADLPVELERKFGHDTQDSWPALVLPGRDGALPVHLRGAIDRVERHGEELRVVDFKSSSLATLQAKLRRDTLLDPELQLAIYAAAVRQQAPDAPVDAQLVSIRDAERTKPLSAAARIDLDELLELDPQRRASLEKNLAEAVHAQAAQMRAGRFEVRPLDCNYCDLKPVCRLVALPTDPKENGGEVSRA